MSLAARRSDLKNHLSHQVVKRHLNLVTTTDLANDTDVAGGVSADLNASLAGIALGARPSSEAVDPKAAV
jgi:ethanolamine utilization protein EutP (predicted NTPase)